MFGWFGSEAEENLGLSKNARSWETVNSNYLKSEGRQSLPQIIESGVMDAEIGATAVVDDREVTKKKDSGGWVRFTHEKPERVKEDALKQRQHQPLNLKRKLSTPLPSTKTSNSSLQRNVKVREVGLVEVQLVYLGFNLL